MAEVSGKCYTFIRVLNIIAALVIIGIGIAGIIVMSVNSILKFQFFLVFSPIFMTLFGILMLAAECQISCLSQRLGFMYSLIGRGIFNIYMSSTVFYYFACGGGSDVAGWILASILFAFGVTYLILHCCGGSQKTEQSKQQLS